MFKRLVIATRRSALALTQTRWVASRLERLYPELEIELLELTTGGDRLAQRPGLGGKGLFVKELEEALARGDADVAVHSMKDVPMHLPAGFVIAAVPEREDARDAFVSNRYDSLEAAPEGAKIGTSSLRRMSAIKARFPRLNVTPLRGNVDTRLKKLDAEEYDAIVLAAAGLKRLELENRITRFIAPDEIIPAPGQGALAIEVLERNRTALELVAPLDHAATASCIAAERALSSALSGDCNLPLGAYAETRGNLLNLRAFVATADGTNLISDQLEGQADNAAALGAELANRLRSLGADRILAKIKSAG
ncbi:MAG: hydroxymethylbilane synthase [Burkholderiales bacterium]